VAPSALSSSSSAMPLSGSTFFSQFPMSFGCSLCHLDSALFCYLT
jgi:hypothetical protein